MGPAIELADSDSSEAVRAAGAELYAAVRATGSHAMIVDPEPEDMGAAVVAVFNQSGSHRTPLGPQFDLGSVLPGSAKAFQAALASVGVTASVRVVELMDSALCVGFRRARDATLFAKLIVDNLAEPMASAHRLGEALAQAGIAERVGFIDRWVSLGNVSVASALALCEAAGCTGLDQGLDIEDWHDLEKLAGLIETALSHVAGSPVGVSSDPSCTRCCGEHEMEIGGMTPDQAQRLILALETR